MDEVVVHVGLLQRIQQANNVTRGGLEALREMTSWSPS